MKNLIAVYQKFKHLDKLLSDNGWAEFEGDVGGNNNKFIDCCRELWMAIKAAGVPDMPTDKKFIDLGEMVICTTCQGRFCTCPERVNNIMTGQYPMVIDPR